MLCMQPCHRMSAQMSFDAAQPLWDGLGLDEDSNTGSGATTPQAHPNGSLAQDAPENLVVDEAGEAPSSNEERSASGLDSPVELPPFENGLFPAASVPWLDESPDGWRALPGNLPGGTIHPNPSYYE